MQDRSTYVGEEDVRITAMSAVKPPFVLIYCPIGRMDDVVLVVATITPERIKKK